MKVSLLIGFALFFFTLVNCAYDTDLKGTFRNEFQYSLTLVSATLTAGQWKQQPPKSIAESNSYVSFFEAIGDQGSSGVIKYSSDNGYAHVNLFWIDTPSNQTFWTDVGPSPFIGGVGNVGNGGVQFWVHEMCTSWKDGKCIKH